MVVESTAQHQLARIKEVAIEALRDTALREDIDRFGSAVDGGKMLRGRMVLELGSATGVAAHDLDRLGASVELLHAASLLHDDIVDGGTERRNAPSVWVSDGIKSAVLVGDLLLSVALGLVQDAGAQHMPVLVQTLRDMCDAEAEQEFSDDLHLDSWEGCIRIARRKTGALFGLSAACAAGSDVRLAASLERAGSDLGTAYQLADDMLDTCDDPSVAGKSLGTDAAGGKLTAATASAMTGVDPLSVINELLNSAEHELDPWPDVHGKWIDYVDDMIRPLVSQYTELARAVTA